MPRRRMVDPGFWDDEKVGQLPRDVRLLYVALWTQADDAGLLEADARRIKAFAFRYDERLKASDVARWLGMLEHAERILRYDHGSRSYYCIRRFHRHQTIERPRKSDIPRPPRQILELLDEKCRALVTTRTSDTPVSPGDQPIQGAHRFAPVSNANEATTAKGVTKGHAAGKAMNTASSEQPLTDTSAKHHRNVTDASPSMPHRVEGSGEEMSREEERREEEKPESLRSVGGHDGETELERLMRLSIEVSDPVVKATLLKKIERLQALGEVAS